MQDFVDNPANAIPKLYTFISCLSMFWDIICLNLGKHHIFSTFNVVIQNIYRASCLLSTLIFKKLTIASSNSHGNNLCLLVSEE